MQDSASTQPHSRGWTFEKQPMKIRTHTIALNTLLISALAASLVACNKAPEPIISTPSPSTTVGTEIDDSVITSTVRSALLADPEIKSLDIKVETNKGEVMLSGFVDNPGQVERARAATQAVSGVKGILNNISVKETSATVGNKIDASIITAKVKAALLNDADVKSFDISVVTRIDEVQLSGYVNNQAQMDRAIEIARNIEGVAKVSNEMSLKK
jgi:hyperosmotically inducible protein